MHMAWFFLLVGCISSLCIDAYITWWGVLVWCVSMSYPHFAPIHFPRPDPSVITYVHRLRQAHAYGMVFSARWMHLIIVHRCIYNMVGCIGLVCVHVLSPFCSHTFPSS